MIRNRSFIFILLQEIIYVKTFIKIIIKNNLLENFATKY